MNEGSRQPWVRVAVLLGLLYAFVGITFAIPHERVKAWRLAAWVVSAVAYSAHIAYEHFRLGNTPLSAARHVAFAVALGAFGLAVGANIHSLRLSSPHEHRHLLLLALGLWPLFTVVPAFFCALTTSWLLSRSSSRPRTN